ncbi:cadmium resistance transporter [Nodosilinea sp. LEGE 06152]|uniref:cadmium resistance transporter n=1 Tax=Nodosilinea sp. LEGE 06152 TaxID=2777966 RepID=UPI00188181CC|nr:cadmium resistance transporter [Nodosilinea sp. LEGE 06152]MBE9160438.1 cadmium resistance transporter [Nodosilinea sp. LEGE 06152]
MTDLLAILTRSAMAFAATNLDDIVILMLFFSQVGVALRKRHIVVGQYVGFAGLVALSLPGFFGSLLFPRPWIGLLGVVPVVIGLSQVLSVTPDEETGEDTGEVLLAPTSGGASWLSPQITSVAAITMANGGDNIGIYMPMFANCDGLGLGVILTVFFGLVGVWCFVAYQLTKVGAISTLLTRYGSQVVPFVLMALGGLILVDSHTLEHRGLTALVLTIIGICVIHLLRAAARLSQSAALGRPVPTPQRIDG